MKSLTISNHSSGLFCSWQSTVSSTKVAFRCAYSTKPPALWMRFVVEYQLEDVPRDTGSIGPSLHSFLSHWGPSFIPFVCFIERDSAISSVFPMARAGTNLHRNSRQESRKIYMSLFHILILCSMTLTLTGPAEQSTRLLRIFNLYYSRYYVTIALP